MCVMARITRVFFWSGAGLDPQWSPRYQGVDKCQGLFRVHLVTLEQSDLSRNTLPARISAPSSAEYVQLFIADAVTRIARSQKCWPEQIGAVECLGWTKSVLRTYHRTKLAHT